MSLIQYIGRALKPKIFCEECVLLTFLGLLNAFNDNFTISCNRQEKYDVIVSDRFDDNLYYTNLIHDGFYFFIRGALLDKFELEPKNYEYIYYASFYIVKKGSSNDASEEYVSTPYWNLSADKKTEKDPIILRNFGDKFNITPHCEPFEIIDHPRIIANLCREFNVNAYLELGVRSCPVPSMISNIVHTIVGVDIVDVPNFPGLFYKMVTDEYFEMRKSKEGEELIFDMIFIDACHNFEQVKLDFNNSLKFTKVGGVIILHDTYPAAEYMTDKNLCSDAYKIVDYIRKCGLQMLNLPISPGLCIVKV